MNNTWIPNKRINWPIVQNLLGKSSAKNQYSNYGPVVEEAEHFYRETLQINNDKAVIFCNSGTSALHTAYLAIKLVEGLTEPVLTTPFNFPSVANGPIDKVIYADLNYDGFFTRRSLVDTNNYDIVIVTNYFGLAQPIDRILEDYEDKFVIFDNAASPYTFYNGKNISNFGNAAIISLHHTKPIGFGEGGLLIIDKKYENKARSLITFGNPQGISNLEDKHWDKHASNFKASDITAAYCLQYLKTNKINRLAAAYQEKFYTIFGILKAESSEEECSFLFPNKSDYRAFFPSCLPILSDDTNIILDDIVRKYYKPLHTGFPACDELFESIHCIACHPDIDTYSLLIGSDAN